MSKPLLYIEKLTNVSNPQIPGFFAVSTAPINVEGDDLPAHKQQVPSSLQTDLQKQQNINRIVEYLYQRSLTFSDKKTDFLELVISTNGFSSSKETTLKRFEEVYSYINHDSSNQFKQRANNLMFIGYRWTSEPLVGGINWWFERLVHAVTALPILPRIILIFGSISILISLFYKPSFLSVLTPISFLFSVLILILTTSFFIVITLILLRVSIYFRDVYRATNFGVPDLVELIRQLDKGLLCKVKEQHIQNIKLITKLKTRLIQKVENELNLQGIFITVEERAIVKVVCERVANDYCKDNFVGEINPEDFNLQDLGSNTLENFNKIVEIASTIIKQEQDRDFVRLRERARDILENKAKIYWSNKNRIKLTFIGHSLGAYLVTSAVRTLSDVFDINSVGTLGLTNKFPSSDIGRVFSLERLVLVSPDIPISTILSGRANFLRSSIRRFKETYLFSNEGDLALRLASTVANYFSFPARTRESGYRLGNVAIKDSLGYGITNLNGSFQEQNSGLLNYLFIDSLSVRNSLAWLQSRYQVDEKEDREQIARLFTYFDCTDYTDEVTQPKPKKRRVLTLAKWRWEPQWIYYIRLIIAYGLGSVDTHGGYFQGQFSQQIMYRLAFLGFGGFLDSLNQENRQAALNYFSQKCRQKKIQVILSPERYKVDITGSDRQQVRRELLSPWT